MPYCHYSIFPVFKRFSSHPDYHSQKQTNRKIPERSVPIKWAVCSISKTAKLLNCGNPQSILLHFCLLSEPVLQYKFCLRKIVNQRISKKSLLSWNVKTIPYFLIREFTQIHRWRGCLIVRLFYRYSDIVSHCQFLRCTFFSDRLTSSPVTLQDEHRWLIVLPSYCKMYVHLKIGAVTL